MADADFDSDSSSTVRSPGEQRRRQVMGDVFVDRALSLADDFSRPLQAHVNDHAWGSTWLRDGLALKQRSLCTVAMLAALGRSQELKGHLRGAVNNGASLRELREVLLGQEEGEAGAAAGSLGEFTLASSGAVPVGDCGAVLLLRPPPVSVDDHADVARFGKAAETLSESSGVKPVQDTLDRGSNRHGGG